MSMAQVGVEITLNLQEGGYLVTGGMMSETIDRRETVVIVEGKCFYETLNMSETVIITNV